MWRPEIPNHSSGCSWYSYRSSSWFSHWLQCRTYCIVAFIVGGDCPWRTSPTPFSSISGRTLSELRSPCRTLLTWSACGEVVGNLNIVWNNWNRIIFGKLAKIIFENWERVWTLKCVSDKNDYDFRYQRAWEHQKTYFLENLGVGGINWTRACQNFKFFLL